MRLSQCLHLKLCHCTQGNGKFMREREKATGKKSLPFHDHPRVWAMKSGSCCTLSPSPMTLALLFCSDLCLKRSLKRSLTSFPTSLFPTNLVFTRWGSTHLGETHLKPCLAGHRLSYTRCTSPLLSLHLPRALRIAA